MTLAAAAERDYDRRARRLDCLARVTASRRTARRRRLRAATEVDLTVRRAEHRASPAASTPAA